ncbi:MAG: hypothetical protein U1E65_20745 [Myxococcota bacterium]
MRLRLLLFLLALGGCDAIYASNAMCRDLRESDCLDHTAPWSDPAGRCCIGPGCPKECRPFCYPQREAGAFVRCRPIRSTGCGF